MEAFRWLRSVEPYLPLRGRWLALPLIALLIAAYLLTNGEVVATPGLQTWWWEDYPLSGFRT